MHRRTRLRITIPFREGLTTTPGKERRDDATTSTDAGGYATPGVLRKNAGVLRAPSASSRSTITGAPTSSRRKICASTSCIWPTTRRSRARRRRSRCAGFGSSSSRRSAGSGRRSGSCGRPASTSCRWRPAWLRARRVSGGGRHSRVVAKRISTGSTVDGTSAASIATNARG